MRRLLIVVVFLLSPALFGQNRDRAVDEVLRTLSATRNFYQVAISPDGKRVAWVQSERGVRDGGIYVAEVRSPDKPRRITAGTEGTTWEDNVAWSPDSKQIAFLSDAGCSGQQQLYAAEVSTGIVRRMTNLAGFLTTPKWSPDGHTLAFLFIENSPRAAGPLQPMTPPSGVIEAHIYEERLNIVDAAGGTPPRAISPADMYVYEYDWAPDGKSFVTIASHGDGDNNWWIAQLHGLELDGRMISLYKPKLQIASPRFSPDGKNIAFIEGLMSDQGVTGGDVYVVSYTGGTVRNLTPGMPASATSLTWSDPGHILFSEIADGNSVVASVDLDSKLSQIWSGPELITSNSWEVGLSLAHDGRQSAMVRSSAQHPPEVWAGPIGAWRQITSDNRDVRPLWGEQRSLHWQSDKFRVQGWLLYPQNYDAKKRYPLIVNVHGGPASACTANWPASNDAPLAALGYFVLCPNPRGSFGQGEAFTEANIKDFGGGDLRDILAGVDQILRELPVDADRLGIQGWSYGGYMTMWAESQTRRFGAAVAGAGISNWLSYYGQNDIDQWLIPYFGASVYDDPAVYARSQPINFVKSVKTPTLILVGDRDGECPAPQSFEWWHALKTFAVPVQFVVYQNEGHMIQQPQHRRDVVVRSVEWFDRWLQAKPRVQAASAQ